MTIELVWHHLVFGTILTAILVRGGALDEPVGVVGLVFMCMTGIALLQYAFTTRRTVVSVRGALHDLEPEDGAPRFPRSHVVLPFLLNHRKGVRRTKDIEFARVGGRRLKLDVTVPARRYRPAATGGRR